MSVLARSVGNAFRNKVRTAAVVAVLAVAIGLALAMLVANQAVGAKVQELNASVGTVLTVNPAGGQGFEGGGEPLTAEQAATAAAVSNVTSVVGTSSLRLRNAAEAAVQTAAGTQAGPGGGQGGPAGQNATTLTTSLTAAIDAGTLGGRNQAANGTTGTTTAQPVRSLPITATGIGGEVDTTGKALAITEGTGLGDYTAESANALLGTTLAEKNNLAIGSTFTINDETFSVAGLFDSGTTFGNNALYLTLPTAQTIAELPGELSSMIVTVDSMENLETAKAALESALGTDKADVTQGQNLESAVSSLGSVKNISFIAFVAALGTAGLIILLIMVMLVRERRREIGVLKAIGAPNRTIGLQFVLEALVLVAMGSAVGAAVASFASGGIASALISTNTTTTAATTTGRGAAMAGAAGGAGMPGGGAGFPGGQGGPLGGASQLLTSVTASASPGVIAAGIAAVFGVAIIGALVPALLTARIRPIEVLRGE
ncbi:ABC transporter permease [Pseudarthrobacter cellobiosi]|uniref:ABC transporter permease n=1 Tax=Pseudarthrobacter cellobiosi TaxID=2953654 RepID=UPI00208E2EF9|nr:MULTISPECIES: FtsX-like permease family protein [unclassified Pseudarthrobacter]MCO4254575.1 FtsX-like permease family protein [Pseudarthrobacter sp. HLT1-5]MCO4274534.1 FtsX-like permease family protein [Pseudarthrobacter sp. HLT3-5]